MTPSIRIDETTGLKLFNTRAAKATEKIAGKGYSAIADEALTTLPPPPAGAVFNAEEQAKYREYKEFRKGSADYMAMEGEFAKYLEDVYSAPPIERDSLTDDCEIVIIGAGFAALILWHQLRQEGFRDVRVCEKGGDVGGTWYWNRYPGIACDVESYSYFPLLEEMGYFPTMKFASGFEILEYCQLMAEKLDFYDRCLFHTTVDRTEWDEAAGRWTVSTDRGDKMRARYVVLANGSLTTPKLARIEGMETFKGEAFHTSRWNYHVDLEGKRVGIIGTGASAVRDQRATTQEEIETWSKEPNWAKKRRDRLAKISSGRTALKGNDDYLAGKVDDVRAPRKFATELSPEDLMERQLNTNFRIMEQIRARVDAIVEDPKTAAALKPYYAYGCKRPTFHDEFLPAFNLPHVHLVDTAPVGVSHINEQGVVHEGVEYPVDVLIYATGFQWMGAGSFNMIIGRDGRSLRGKWGEEGVKTFLGLHSHGFPNLFIISGPQSGGGQFNFTRTMEGQTDYITWLLKTSRDRDNCIIDVDRDAEVAYAEHCREADIKTQPFRDCLSYYNGDGNAEPGSLAYYGGVQKWHEIRMQAQETLEPYVFQQASS